MPLHVPDCLFVGLRCLDGVLAVQDPMSTRLPVECGAAGCGHSDCTFCSTHHAPVLLMSRSALRGHGPLASTLSLAHLKAHPSACQLPCSHSFVSPPSYPVATAHPGDLGLCHSVWLQVLPAEPEVDLQEGGRRHEQGGGVCPQEGMLGGIGYAQGDYHGVCVQGTEGWQGNVFANDDKRGVECL